MSGVLQSNSRGESGGRGGVSRRAFLGAAAAMIAAGGAFGAGGFGGAGFGEVGGAGGANSNLGAASGADLRGVAGEKIAAGFGGLRRVLIHDLRAKISANSNLGEDFLANFAAQKIYEIDGDIAECYGELRGAFAGAVVAGITQPQTLFVLRHIAADSLAQVVYSEAVGGNVAWVIAPRGVRI